MSAHSALGSSSCALLSSVIYCPGHWGLVDFLATASPKPLCRPAPAGSGVGELYPHETSELFCSSSPQSYLTCPANLQMLDQGFLHGLLGGYIRDSAIPLCFKCVSWIFFPSSALMSENLGAAFPTPQPPFPSQRNTKSFLP